jgi:hypothetical protein
MGHKIVTSDWIDISLEQNKFLPTDNYNVLSANKVNISAVAQKGEYILNDMHVWITSRVRPLANEWRDVITTAGGTLLDKRPKTFMKDIIIIATVK